MDSKYVLSEYYVRYLRDVREISESSIKHYQDALKYISKYLVNAGKIENSIYEVYDIGQLEVLREFLYNDSEFMALNIRGHQMYSAGLNNYYKFASGKEFEKLGQRIQLLDVPLPVGTCGQRTSKEWNRSSIIKNQVIESSNYKCEIDITHQTFVAKKTGKQYMEGHHLIPMKKQSMFESSLDIYANIVCLCPVCHKLLHYGMDANKKNLLNIMYTNRTERLAKSGIRLSKEEFISIVI